MGTTGLPHPHAADESLGDPASSLQTHSPSICNLSETCDARNYCGHARVHEHELMYDKCAGHWCSFIKHDVKCIEPTEAELKMFLFLKKSLDSSPKP